MTRPPTPRLDRCEASSSGKTHAFAPPGLVPVEAGRPSGIGVDIVDLSRMNRVVRRLSHSGRLERMFSPGEIAYAAGQPRPLEHLAAAFAAKEALSKALGVSVFRWRLRDVEITHTHTQPVLALYGLARQDASDRVCTVSLSHSTTYACAAVLVTGPPCCPASADFANMSGPGMVG